PQFRASRGDSSVKSHPFEGVLPNLERRDRETDSQMVLEELAKYLSVQPCPACEGSRLRTEARNVFIGDKNIHGCTTLPVEQALEYFKQLHLAGHRGEIAEKILKEIRERLQFLVNVGLEYLSLSRRSEEHTSELQ